MRPRLRFALFAAAAVLGHVAARADVEVTNTLLLRAYPQARYGTTPLATETVAPIYEMVTLAARDVQNPVAERLELVVSAWGGANLGHNPWWNGYLNSGAFSGDLGLAFVKGEFGKGAVVARLGRMMVAGGNSRMVQLDGASLLWRAPAGFSLSLFGGSPVSARFDARGGPYDANPVQGDVTAGGRLAWTHQVVEVGASTLLAWDHGSVSRQEVGGDLRLSPLRWLDLLAFGSYELDRQQLAEIWASAIARAWGTLSVSADYRHTTPSLFLSSESILWVFTDAAREDLGLNVHWTPVRAWSFDLGGAALLTESGFRALARGTWRPDRRGAAGLEVSYLDTPENAYLLARLFGSRRFGDVVATVDVQGMFLGKAVNDQTTSFLGSASLGYPLARGLTATVAASAGVTPWYQNRFDVLAKLVWQNFPAREVRP
ncbi:MAG TPA: hypothetical protein VIV59_12220 [Anaeromyxobacteraceae bacterium]